ncbi:hypothetical protein M427DRAFT_222695 [Gonapodya prolifera JEL478]|uniref:RNA-dependent RNA polymerase n=1 Tax=Gonapodya prolifera (strain JEL478) TaxID=1344416 RepID=A0A139AN19_GONPJ|nr:hypothetical protein M427DRAFT_222695 [Gonapodya prolifera JEL478]|eukprot:KXS18132.1 hypothetical protein M427DRAFT_222695 [Gonapodya prolifera JEL478]
MVKYFVPTSRWEEPLHLEVVKFSYISTPGLLNTQFVMVLQEGGVRTETFRELREQAEVKIVDIYLPEAPGKVLPAIEALSRETKRFTSQGAVPTPDPSDPDAPKPSNFELHEALLAGFDRTEPYIGEKLRACAELKLRRVRETAPIPVPESVSLAIVPDPTEELPEGYVFFQIDGIDNALKGKEVLVLRNPAYRLSDCQKLRVADADRFPKLRPYTDVLIMSVQGTMREAERLGNGDYDGDRVVIIYDQTIVAEFSKGHLDI